MNLKTVTKRSGHTVAYNRQKIVNAIAGANADCKNPMTEKDVEEVASQVEWDIQDRENIGVEEIQDIVEQELMKYDFYDVAKKYITYRARHAERREAQKHLMSTYSQIFFGDAKDSDLRRDNANINTDAPMGAMLKLGAEGAKHFVDNYVLDEEFHQADSENWIHIHDKDFSLITFNCCQIDLLKLFHGGFSTGHGFLREPNSIRAYASLACIAIQSNQNDMFGGQSINAFDIAMAEGVRKSFHKAVWDEAYKSMAYRFGFQHLVDEAAFRAALKKHLSFENCHYTESAEDPDAAKSIETIARALDAVMREDLAHPIADADTTAPTIYQLACADVVEETHQAMEALIHNFNTLHSRAGAQVPFSSINYGLDTTSEGRLATREVLNAIWSGLGNGETPIFPISVFQIKAGINYNPGDPNYDLFQQACKTSAKRLFPNFVNVDAPYNLQYYKPGNYNSAVATMGCRTRVVSNVNGPEEFGSRGNFSFTTINLPKLAIEAHKKFPKDQEKEIAYFYDLFDKYIDISKRYLEARYDIIAHKKAMNFPFLMGQHVWMDSEKLNPEDEIAPVLKHCSISIGFCGLAECLKELTGKHHGESEASQKLGLAIIGHLRQRTDEFTEETHMNWSTFGTPAESTAGQFQRANQKAYGKIPGVTDRPYMTNSSHVPVYYPIKAIDKIRIEAPYHALENAGHIAYIELDGDTTKNVKAFESVVRAMHDANMGYFSVNHPVDRDPVCGYTGLIENECPHCHRKEVEKGTFVIPRQKA
ncbi:MAG: anaerobic ribonucleoside triphosphate reductase [Selenomonadaceae bacterium]|nr:anaerobic ribonucleoside triphosphate reductase [Selenomonadaceae bacterium]MDY2686132.1 anaerobic ribonucleoside triphosphate reductase [Selenomonadaceae bacterium]